jgi:hypothetical protein
MGVLGATKFCLAFLGGECSHQGSPCKQKLRLISEIILANRFLSL